MDSGARDDAETLVSVEPYLQPSSATFGKLWTKQIGSYSIHTHIKRLPLVFTLVEPQSYYCNITVMEEVSPLYLIESRL